MKKRSIAAVGLLSAFAAVNLAPASALATAATASAVSDVKLAWADAAHSAVKITWTSPLGDKVAITTNGGSPLELGATAAGAPDELIVPVTKFAPTYDATWSSQIVVTDSNGAKGESKKFDQYVPRAIPTGVTFGPGNTVQGGTTLEQKDDLTPNDPLDVSVPLKYATKLLVNCTPKISAVTSSSKFSFPAPGVPSLLWINTSNEWPSPWTDENYVGFELNTAGLKTTAPTTTTYGQTFTLSGVVLLNQLYYTYWNGNCGIEQVEPNPRLVVVQARKDSASPWGVVGTTKTDAVGKFSYRVTNPGTRQYRVVVPNAKTTTSLDYGVASLPRTITATTKVVAAKFLSSVVAYGKPATAYLSVLPGGSQRALLQAKSTTGVWTGVTYKTLAAGKGSVAITWKRRGLTAFRWYSPAVKTSSGLTVGAAFSPVFYLSVR
ncbi:hypothetical protein [Kribbella deserti]|uniref:Uncharacterized protein n=1 Tax=Kribbella deserti TaxID=1926257 RepID=A0ABV6QK50_9ACTN